MNGNIHSIDTFSTLDGPGIRTVIFMQGCHLRCQYCHNPDTWDCNSASAKHLNSSEIMKIIMRNTDYFKASGGGVTFSGGEPLLQDKFVKTVAKKCKNTAIHTAIDTSLYVASSAVEEVLPYIDLFLADIKQMNPNKSKALTGSGNNLNISNILFINEHRIDIWIRYVIVPGLTDGENDLALLGDFVAGLDSVKRIELLPYHSLGSHKWPLLGMEYKLSEVVPPSAQQMQEIKAILHSIARKPVFIPGNMV